MVSLLCVHLLKTQKHSGVKPPGTGGSRGAAPITVRNIELFIFFFTSGSSCCIHKSVKGRRMEGELVPTGEDSMLPSTVGKHSGNVLPFQKLLVLPLGWRLNLSSIYTEFFLMIK